MKIIQLFNSSLVSGPENLIVRNLQASDWNWEVWNLEEIRSPSHPGADLRSLCESLGITYRAISVKSRRDPEAIAELRSALESAKPNIVHAHDVKASTYLAWTGLKADTWVSTHHGVRGRPDLKTRLLELFYRWHILPKFARVLAVSHEDEVLLKKSLGARVRLLRNGIPLPDRISGVERLALRRRVRSDWSRRVPDLSLNEKDFVVAFVGRLSKEKNPLFALDVAELGDMKLLFIGEGVMRDEVLAQIKARGLGQRVACLGYEPQMLNCYAALDGVISVSLAEGLPLNLLESAAREVPFLARAVGGIPEISDGIEETLMAPDLAAVSYAERLRSWNADRDFALMLGDRLRDRVQKEFSDTVWRNQLAELYREISSAD